MQSRYIKHHIQREIFQNLRKSGPTRYKNLKIDSIESSLFVYHLKELTKSSLIEKDSDGMYRLTENGVKLAQHYSSEIGDMRLSVPSYTIIIARSTKNKWLLYKREKAPFMGYYSTVSGKIHHGESLNVSLKRETNEVFGTEIITNPQFICYSSIVIHGAESDATTHITGPVWFIDKVREESINKNYKKGVLCWENWEKLPYDRFIPGWNEMVGRVKSGDKSILDLELHTNTNNITAI